jgi:hypothetical protein
MPEKYPPGASEKLLTKYAKYGIFIIMEKNNLNPKEQDMGNLTAEMAALASEPETAQERARAMFENRLPIHKGFFHKDLEAAFHLVQNPADWRAPIAVWVNGEAVNLTVAAIEFFTATNPRVSLDAVRMRYLIESEGYRNGPAGDH